MKLTKMIYVASSYTCKTSAEEIGIDSSDLFEKYKKIVELRRYERITQVIGVLQDRYPYAFIGPITQSHHTAKHMKNNKTTFDAWETRDLTYISRCDEIWVYADEEGSWKESTGVMAEIEFCVANDIPVKFLHHTTLRLKSMKIKEDSK